MKSIITYLTLAIMLFVLPVFAQGAEPLAGSSKKQEFLFVVSATSGTFDGKILTLSGIPNITYFSERPNRITGQKTPKAFIKMWNKAAEGFGKDHPNAALAILGDKPNNVVVELIKAQEAKDNSVTFDVKVLPGGSGKLPKSFGASSLFIDAIPTPVNGQITD